MVQLLHATEDERNAAIPNSYGVTKTLDTLKGQQKKREGGGSPENGGGSSRRSSGVVLARGSFVKDEQGLGLSKDAKTGQVVVGEEEEAKISTVNSMFLLFSGAMGGGVLGLPFVVRENGILFGLILIAIGGVFSAVSEYYLIKCTRVANEELAKLGKKPLSSYSALMQYATEKCWPGQNAEWVKLALNLIFVVYLWGGVVVSCTQYMFSFTEGVLAVPKEDRSVSPLFNFLMSVETDASSGIESVYLSWTALSLLTGLWFLLCIPKDLSSLSIISYYPFVTIMLTVFFTIGAFFALPRPGWAPLSIEQDPTGLTQGIQIPRVSLGRYGGWPIFILSSRFVFAYMTHTNVVPVASALADKSDKTALRISIINVTFIAVFYSVICLMTTLVAGTGLGMPFTKFYTEQTDSRVVATVARYLCLMLLVMMLAAIPLNFTPLRESVWDVYLYAQGVRDADAEEHLVEDEALEEARALLPGSENRAAQKISTEMTFATRATLTLTILVSGVVSARLIPGLDIVIDFLGGTLGTFVMIAGPAFMMRQILGEKKTSTCFSMWSLLFFAYTVFCLVGFFMNQSKLLGGLTDPDATTGFSGFVNNVQSMTQPTTTYWRNAEP